MINEECLVMQNEETKDIVVFTHAYNQDGDEVYTYANKLVLMALSYDNYQDMWNYYDSLNYKVLMHTQKA